MLRQDRNSVTERVAAMKTLHKRAKKDVYSNKLCLQQQKWARIPGELVI